MFATARGMTLDQLYSRYPAYDIPALENILRQSLEKFHHTTVVLDDDPTGTQTVFNIPVVTDWNIALLDSELRKKPRMLFILTNSRSLTAKETEDLHREIARNLMAASRSSEQPFLLVSRGDSTLRGHFPLETETLRQELEHGEAAPMDGEIVCPFFLEGGRFTVDNVHYLMENNTLLPVGESEFAKDKTFGYKSSDLREWIEEKSAGTWRASDVASISLEDLRSCKREKILNTLLSCENFKKVVVNAISYDDLKCFVPELLTAIHAGKRFLLRTASSILQVMANCNGGKLLTHEDLISPENSNGGVVLVGSHVKKTTRQLECLLEHSDLLPLEFNQHLVLDPAAFEREIARVSAAADNAIRSGRSVAVYTRRERLDLNTSDKEEELRLATRISDGVIRIISGLQIRPGFIIAKGGITSSDVATKGLSIRRARIMGQILPGIPVWEAGAESRFPGLPYVIFPGNVGSDNSLLLAVEKLKTKA